MAQNTRPIVGINADFVPAMKNRPAHMRLDTGYADAVLDAHGLPVVMPLLGENEMDAFLDRVDGFLLTGGLELDPKRHGLPTNHALVLMPPRRFDHDRLLLHKLLDRRMPILAIGAGMHLLNLALQGTMHFFLSENLPKSMPHFDVSDEGPHRHALFLEPNTRLEEIYGDGEIRVNSCHRQAVNLVGQGLRVGAKAPDGVIEAIEATDPDWFCVGVQWQPESTTASALDMQLFECFVQSCTRESQPLRIAA